MEKKVNAMSHSLLSDITKKYMSPRLVACSGLGFSKKDVNIAKKYNVIAYELRLDLLHEIYPDTIEKEIDKNMQILHGKNLIFTIRSKKEGGLFKGTSKEKESIYHEYLEHAFALDIEICELPIMKDFVKEAKLKNKIIIASYHNFSEVPSFQFLQKLVRQGKKYGADIVKIAVYADELLQITPLMELQRKEKSVVLSLMTMGKTALLSRAIFALEGSIWTYACLGKPTAPNQPTCAQIFELAKRLLPTD